MPHALIVAHGQPSDQNPPEVSLARLPFFALNGDHYRQDILPARDQASFAGLRLPVLGAFAHVPDLIARALENATIRKAVA